MAQKYTVMESWPALKDDLLGLLSDTDAWLISELKRARKEKDWAEVEKIIDIMESIHDISHAH